MILFRAPILLILGMLTTLMTSCKKEDPIPITGDLKVTISNASQLQGSMYALYTEAGWTSVRTSPPLRQGPIKADFTISNLNPGNYVFTLNSTKPETVQVTAGKTNNVYYTY